MSTFVVTPSTEGESPAPAAGDAIASAIAAAAAQFGDAAPEEVVASAEANHPSRNQPRDESGRWTDQQEQPPADDTPADPAERAEEDDNQEEADPAAAEPYVLTIRPRADGQEPVEIELEGVDPEVVEHLNRLQNDGMRRDEFNRQSAALEAQRAEMREFEDELTVDPVGVMLRYVAPDVRREVVRALLAQDDQLFNDVFREASAWDDDPRARQFAANELRTQLDTRRESARRDLEESRAAHQTAQALWTAVEGLVPSTAEDEDVSDFLTDARSYLRNVVQEREITPEEIPALLERRVRRYFGNGVGAPTASSPKLGTANPASQEAADLAERAKQARETGSRLVRASMRRKDSAATSPSGAGAGPTTLSIPKGLSIKDAIAHARQNLG